jgi:hypothetical protein
MAPSTGQAGAVDRFGHDRAQRLLADNPAQRLTSGRRVKTEGVNGTNND